VRRALVAGALATAALAAAGCDSGPPVSQTRTVGSSYTRLQVDGSLNLDVQLLNRPDPGVRITAGKKAIDRIRTEVEDDTLKISTKSRGLTIGPDPLGDVSVSLGVSALSGLTVEGSASVQLSGLSAKAFDLRVDGSGDVIARGRVDDLVVEVDGSADTDLSGLATQNADVRTDGSGQTELRVARSLQLVMEGSGDVTYRGRPTVSSRQEGSGDLTQVGG
jgi:Putative auto-transporter adhesin, head GIN domain